MCIRDRVWEGSLLDARKKASITRRQALFGDHKDVAAAPFAGGLSFWVGIAMVRPPYAMSVVQKSAMLLIRGALAAQVWIYRRTKARCAGARTLSVTASEITNEEYETAWARRRRSLLKRIRCASAGDPAASAEDPWGTVPPRSRASAADEPRTGARRRPHPRPPGYPTPDAPSRTDT